MNERNEPLVFSYQHQTVFVRREVYEQFGIYDTSYKALADADFEFRCQCGGIKFAHIPILIAHFRIGGLSSVNPRHNYYEYKRSICRLNNEGKLTTELNKYAENELHLIRRNFLLVYLSKIRLVREGTVKSFIHQLFYNRSKKKKFLIWGTGKNSKIIYNLFAPFPNLLYGFIDSNQNKQTLFYERKPIFSPKELNLNEFYIIISTDKYQDEIVEYLEHYDLKMLDDFMTIDSLFLEMVRWQIQRWQL